MIYLLIILISFLASLIVIPILRNFGIKKHFCDKPDGNILKIHKKPIPYLGGVGIFFGFITGLIFARLFHQISGTQVLGIIIGSIVILFLGFWDDLKWKRAVNPTFKLLCQFLAGALIVFILTKIGVNFKFSLSPIICALVAGFYIVGAMNAINMEDGMDGLAGGLVLISFIGFAALAIITNNTLVLVLSLTLVGGISGFLIYNWHPASIFMGDNGSHFLGFLIATLAIIFSSHPLHNSKQFIGPILIIGLPIIDVVWTILRRLKAKKSPLTGDRKHSYDRLHQKGLSTKKTVLICYAVQIIIVGVGIIIYIT